MLRRGSLFAVLFALVLSAFPLVNARGSLPPGAPSDSALDQNRKVEPVVLTGAQFADWSAGPEISYREPTQPPNGSCPSGQLHHNCSERPLISNANNPDAQQPTIAIPNPRVGKDVSKLMGYRWTGASYVQIPFQVDERFTRYISNLASNCGNAESSGFCVGFGAYAGADAQPSYVYDRDIYKYTADATDPCYAAPTGGPEQDPIKGLDDNDEMAFLYRDTGAKAPSGSPSPTGVALKEVRIDDPSSPGRSAPRYVYVGASNGLPGSDMPAFNKDNGYMRYVRDADSYKYQETSSNYGNAPRGKVCPSIGAPKDNVPRRPKDTAWILSPRYAFRYAARWSLEGVRVNPDPNAQHPLASYRDYSDPLLDQWKARAYAQTRQDNTPCCGFETEEGWQASSVTLGEKAGPVRVIRTTQGSDSGTNTVRTEIFYPDVIQQFTYLRVHPIPPLGGIFSYWDQHSGPNEWYFNPQNPNGVPVDGHNDEVVGNMDVHLGGDNVHVHDYDPLFNGKLPDGPGLSPIVDQNCNLLGAVGSECATFDVTDPTLNATGTVDWEEFGSPNGSMVFRSGLNVQPEHASPGDVQALLTIPYYRDEGTFDDGTGTRDDGSGTCNPGPREGDPESTCPLRDRGLYGAHGVQVMLTPETDNGASVGTKPITEIDAQTRIVVLPPQLDAQNKVQSVGASYGHSNDLPLEATAVGQPDIDQTSITIGGDSSGVVGDAAHLQATLSDQAGPVSGATLHFAFQGMNYDGTTDSSGTASVTVPVGEPAGKNDVVVGYDGDGLVRSPSSAKKSFTVKRVPTLTFTESNARSAKIGEDASFSARLTDVSGAVSGATLHFDFQGVTKDGTTDADGLASVTFTPTAPAGDTVVNVRFDGDAIRTSTSASTPFSIERRDSKISFVARTGRNGSVVVSITLVDKDSGAAVGGRTVTVFVNGTQKATATTNGAGKATATFKFARPQGKTFRVDFGPDDTYTGSSAQAKFGRLGASGSS